MNAQGCPGSLPASLVPLPDLCTSCCGCHPYRPVGGSHALSSFPHHTEAPPTRPSAQIRYSCLRGTPLTNTPPSCQSSPSSVPTPYSSSGHLSRALCWKRHVLEQEPPTQPSLWEWQAQGRPAQVRSLVLTRWHGRNLELTQIQQLADVCGSHRPSSPLMRGTVDILCSHSFIFPANLS